MPKAALTFEQVLSSLEAPWTLDFISLELKTQRIFSLKVSQSLGVLKNEKEDYTKIIIIDSYYMELVT